MEKETLILLLDSKVYQLKQTFLTGLMCKGASFEELLRASAAFDLKYISVKSELVENLEKA